MTNLKFTYGSVDSVVGFKIKKENIANKLK